jgi:hypothetical protein
MTYLQKSSFMISKLFLILDLFVNEAAKLLSVVICKKILTKLGAFSWSFAYLCMAAQT